MNLQSQTRTDSVLLHRWPSYAPSHPQGRSPRMTAQLVMGRSSSATINSHFKSSENNKTPDRW